MRLRLEPLAREEVSLVTRVPGVVKDSGPGSSLHRHAPIP